MENTINVFSDLVDKKPCYSNKTFILAQIANEMITCINTNISTHFVKHLFKYINCLFKEPKSLEIKKEKDKIKRKEIYKELNQEIRYLKSDLINNKIENSKEEYHNWISEILTPKEETKCRIFEKYIITWKMLFRKSNKTRRIYQKINKIRKG